MVAHGLAQSQVENSSDDLKLWEAPPRFSDLPSIFHEPTAQTPKVIREVTGDAATDVWHKSSNMTMKITKTLVQGRISVIGTKVIQADSMEHFPRCGMEIPLIP